MSRSRKKVAKIEYAYGNNTPFYKLARRHLRVINNQELRKLLSHFSLEEVVERILEYQNKHDRSFDEWNEPTDGSRLIFKGSKRWKEDSTKKYLRK